MAGAHQVLIGFYHIGGDTALRCAAAARVLSIGRLVQLQPEPDTRLADGGPHHRRILADTGGKHDAVETSEWGRKRGDVAGNPIVTRLDGKACTWAIAGPQLA